MSAPTEEASIVSTSGVTRTLLPPSPARGIPLRIALATARAASLSDPYKVYLQTFPRKDATALLNISASISGAANTTSLQRFGHAGEICYRAQKSPASHAVRNYMNYVNLHLLAQE